VGNLTLIAGSVAQLATGAANFQADDILLRSNMQSSFTAGGPVNVGNVAIIGPLGATLTSAAANFVSGNIFLKSISASAFNVTGAATVGNILIGGNFTSQLSTGTGNFTAGNITINGQFQSTLNAFSPSFTAGNITFNGQFQSTLNSTAPNFTAGNVAINTGTISSLAMTSGTMSVGRLTLAALASQVNIGGNSLTINGDLKVLGKLQTMVSFNTTALSEIKGNALVAGGSFLNNFSTNEFFEAEKDLLLLFGNGGSLVTIGNGVGTVPILGKLIVRTGRGDDFINLQRVDVTGATSISTGFGADNLAIDDGAEFNSTFTANMGAGNDNIFIAQAIGSFQAVSFAGLTTINAGAGNDTLLLGANPGDANSTADFAAGFAHKIIGGLGINTFDGLTGGIPPISPAKYTGLTAANFLSWTDPNP
jgi:hypothetical protein